MYCIFLLNKVHQNVHQGRITGLYSRSDSAAEQGCYSGEFQATDSAFGIVLNAKIAESCFACNVR